MEGAGLRQERRCADCGGWDFVEDHAAGDIVCKGCGLVAEAHIIDERSEWRTFGDKEKEGDDPSRVGAAANPLMDDAGLSTGIGKLPGGAGGAYSSLVRLHNRQNLSDRAMQTASREISSTCERLRVTDAVKNSALEVYKDAHESKGLKGRSLKAVYAACIYVAAKREGNNRTFKEICAVMPEVSKVEIGRCFTSIDKHYKRCAQQKALAAGKSLSGAVAGGTQRGHGSGTATQATDLIKRFMSRLGVDKKLSLFAHRVGLAAGELAAQEAVPWSSRDPATQACAIIYGVMQINRPGKLVQDSDAKREVLQQLESSCREGLMATGGKQAAPASRGAKGSSRTPPPASPAAAGGVAAGMR
eukprot:gene13110-13238_t